MKKLFISSVVLPIFSFILIILKVVSLIDWDFQAVLAPFYVWLVLLAIMLIIWLVKEDKKDD